MANSTVVLGIYESRTQLERGIQELRTAGFRTDSISALFPEGDQTREFAHEKGTKAPEGATTGGTTGAVVGGTLGWLAGIGALAIPGLGPFIAAGPIMAALAGAGVGGAVGGVAGALIGMGFPEYEAKRYEGHVKEGGILVSVSCANSDEEDRVEDILERTGARDVSSTGAASADDEAKVGERTRQRQTAQPVTSGVRATGASDVSDWSTYQADCRLDYDNKYARTGTQWSTMEPAYQFGHRMAGDPRYRGRSWSEVESDVQTAYLREKPNGTWESVKDAVRYGWERVSGRR
jgi:hypothetical protein